jgi:nicotinamidase-related amidase
VPRKTSSKRRRSAILLVDVINDLAFPGSRPLVRAAEAMSVRLARLAERARAAAVPVVYVNDNFGRWESDWQKVLDRCAAPSSPGRRVVERLRPHPGDYFVLKPRHSGFFGTPLDLLLQDLGVTRVVVTGIATDICVFFTANDAYMREYAVVVPKDCVAANTPRKTAFALQQVRDVLKGRTPAGAEVRL